MKNIFKKRIIYPLIGLFLIFLFTIFLVDIKYKPIYKTSYQIGNKENIKFEGNIDNIYQPNSDYFKLLKNKKGHEIDEVSFQKHFKSEYSFFRINFHNFSSLGNVENFYNALFTLKNSDKVYRLEFKFLLYSYIIYYFLFFVKYLLFILIIYYYFYIFNFLNKYFLENKQKYIKTKYVFITSLVIILFTFIEIIINIGGSSERGAGLVALGIFIGGFVIFVINFIVSFFKGKKIIKQINKLGNIN